MHIKFAANNVSYNEAIDGEIVQVVFDEDTDNDSTEISKYYLLISVNYEFGSNLPSIEWFDGNECNGGASITNYRIDRSLLQISLDNSLSFDIAFSTEEQMYKNIESFLSSLVGEGKNA